LYYKLNTKDIEKRSHFKKGEVVPAFDTELIDLEKAFENIDSDSYKYNRRSLPISKVLDTLLMLAEVLSFRRNFEEALRLFEYVQKGFHQLFGTDTSLRNSYLEQQVAECYLKQLTTRDTSKVTDAIEHAQKSVSIIETLIGKTEDGPEINNCLLTLRIQTLADCQKEGEQIEDCEKTFKRSH
jgi:tetratricopeptide (TPR) repeat protein